MNRFQQINARIIVAVGLAMGFALLVWEWIKAGARFAREAGDR